MRYLFLTVFVLLLIPFIGHAVSPQTISYLQNNVDGSPRTSEHDWVVMALGVNGIGVERSMLAHSPRTSATDIERLILTDSAIGGNPVDFFGTNLAERLTSDFVHDGQIGHPQLLTDDAFGLLAFYSAGVTSDHSVVKDARQYLIANQNTDGGWGQQRSGRSSVDMTAVTALALLKSGSGVEDVFVMRAQTFLRHTQNDDGGFPFFRGASSNASSTAWAMWFFNAAGADASRTHSFLETLRVHDGSYANEPGADASPLTTAYVAIALAGKSYPVRSYVAPVIVPPQQQEQPREVVTSQAIPPPVIQQQPAALEPVVKKNVPTKKKIMKKAKKSRKVMKVKKKVKKERIKPR